MKIKSLIKWENIDIKKELFLTFSARPSLLSSKKIERFIIFWTFLILTSIYLIGNLKDMEAMDFIQVIGLWLAYGGYNSFMNFKDKKIEKTPNQSESTSEETTVEETP